MTSSHSKFWRSGRLLALAAVAITANVAFAQANRSEFDPTPLEFAQLPPYCQGQFKPELAAADPAYRMPECGPRFNHFCPALVALMRASQITKPKHERQWALAPARGNMKYTTDSMPASCPLAPQVHAAQVRLQILEKSLR
jgi:hypothetical protein